MVRPTEPLLIVNADDFCQTHGINRGVVRAHEHGILTSASLMVRWPAAAEAAAYARDHPRLSVGLHVDLGEWRYDGSGWQPIYTVADVRNRNAVVAEVRHQLEAFRKLVGRDPTHLDSHQHVHREEPVRSVIQRLARQLGVRFGTMQRRSAIAGVSTGRPGRANPCQRPFRFRRSSPS